MDEFLQVLQQQIEKVEEIANKIENGEQYQNDLQGYLPSLNQLITIIFEMIADPQIQLDVNQEFIVQVLNDIMYGMEHEDNVFLLDVLRYGLLEIYYYIGMEVQGEECYE